MALASKIRIEIDGEELKDFLNFTINQSIYTYHEFEVVCRMDTFEDTDGFVMEQSKKFIGLVITISIEAKLKGNSQTSDHMFKGLITGIRAAKSDTGQADHVILSGHSPDILMSDNPGSHSFENKTLKQIADDVLKPYPKDVLKSKTDPVKDARLPYVVQYNESRYDFIRRLATRYGEWFFYDGAQLFFGKLPDNKTDLKLGTDLTDFSFSIRMNPLKFKYVGYDYTSAKALETASAKSGGKDNLNEYGGFAHDKSAKQYTQQSTLFYNHLNVPDNNYTKELDHVVGLEEGASALNMSVMQGSSQNPQLKLGTKVNIKALKVGQDGDVDYGEYIITSLSHTCDNTMNYQNNFEGIPAEAKIPDYTNSHAIPYCETQSAIVKDNNDPDKLGRVKVNFFWQGNNLLSPWLRIANTYAGKEAGFYFIPEVDDEVLVGFEEGNAEKPYVIGSMYHGKNKPEPAWPDRNNSFKGILTKSKLKIEFDDKKKMTTIETPGGNKIVLSDDGKSILFQDQNQNKIELDSGGITMDSMKDINITSKSKITIEGATGVDISSVASFTAKGNASAELSSVGNTTVKGTMVMIN
ncbi:MAG: type VI secretion system tip protein VgrG [Cyclobacteriaceae bacterium]|nr:type VI secretion system tip protein VgrG [Cyclobacteriaceae bacterium]MCK5467227.1 type VI secretion system tip protein VgrG [Cyclobacteriaceae bacterium]